MNNSEKQNLKNSINKAMKTPTNLHQIENINYNNKQNEYDEKQRKKRFEKPLKMFGGVCISAVVVAAIFTPTSSTNTSESAKNALENKVSTAVSAGTILLAEDENVAAKDYTITHKSGSGDTKIWVWDYAAEDGDYVQVIVNGSPLSDSFMITNKPKVLIVPATGEVQIKGIKDGGGGITYAVRYELNGTSYFNGTTEGELNTYTLINE